MIFNLFFVLFFAQKSFAYGPGGGHHPSGGGSQFHQTSNWGWAYAQPLVPKPPVNNHYGSYIPYKPLTTAPPTWQPPRKCIDTGKFCANIKTALAEISRGAQQISNGSNVNVIKDKVDGPAQASIINGNWTLLQIAADITGDSNAKACLQDTAKQAGVIADYIETIKPQLTNNNDTDKMVDVQRTLRSVQLLNQELQSPGATYRIYNESDKICANITTNFDRIDNGTAEIANGGNPDIINAEVDGLQRAAEIRYNYNLLLIIANRVYSKSIEDCLRMTSDRAQIQYTQISAILPQLTQSQDLDKVNDVFKSFRQIIELQKLHVQCTPK